MTKMEMVETIKVLTNTLQVLTEMESMVQDRNEEVIKATRDRICAYVKAL